MRKFTMLNVVPVYPGHADFTVSEILRQKRDAGIDKILLSLSWHPEGTPARAKIAPLTDAFRAIREQVKHQVSVGALIQSTQGHGWSGKVPLTQEPFQRIVYGDSTVLERMCPLDPEFRSYIANCVEATVKAGAEFLLIDDDFGLRREECFCPLHLAKFNEAAHTNYTKEDLVTLLNHAPEGDPLVELFCQQRLETTLQFAGDIRAAIDRVNPAVRCGLCTPWLGHGFVCEAAHALAGANAEPFLRVNNATYGRQNPAQCFELSLRTPRQMVHLVDFNDILSEADTFPQNYYSESAGLFHAHLTQDILSGMTGTKLWVSEFDYPEDTASQKRYEDVLTENRNFYDTLLNTVDGITWKGAAGALLKPKNLLHPFKCRGAFYTPDWVGGLLAPFGLPMTYQTAGGAAISTLTGAEAENLTDEELRKYFSGPLLLDSSAALLLSEKYSHLMGVKASPGDDSFTFSREQEMDGSRYLSLLWEPGCAYLEPAGAAVHTGFFSGKPRCDEGEFVAPAITFYKNELGGRIAVTGWNPQMPYYKMFRPYRRKWLLDIMDFLSDGTFEMAVNANQQVIVQHGILKDGRELLAVMSTAIDKLPEIPVRMIRTPETVERLQADGTWTPVQFRRESAQCVILEGQLEICKPLIYRMSFPA